LKCSALFSRANLIFRRWLGVPDYTEAPVGPVMMMRNITLTGGACPARAYIQELMPEILDGTIEPGRVVDTTIGLDQVPDG